jgi:hypothetical protein
MSDWDFLHEMHARGCSPEEIADAAAVGYAPWQEAYLSKEWIDAELEDQTSDTSRSLDPRAYGSFRPEADIALQKFSIGTFMASITKEPNSRRSGQHLHATVSRECRHHGYVSPE